MSVQTDCEMLSIEVMETYAEKYDLTGDEVAELFHKNQFFEKILIQHEYLHQISFEEVMDYVEKVIAEDSRELIVYHGTCSDFDKIDLKNHTIVAILEKDFIRPFCVPSRKNGHIDFL